MAHQREGEALAQQHCQSCHLLPKPESLDKRTWLLSVLPAMAPRVGRFGVGDTSEGAIPSDWFERGRGGERVQQSRVFPTAPVVTRTEWSRILAYYVGQAPDKLAPQPAHSEPSFAQEQFKADLTRWSDVKSPNVTMIHAFPEQKRVYFGTSSPARLYDYVNGSLGAQYPMHGAPVRAAVLGQMNLVLDIGSLLATDDPRGELIALSDRHPGKRMKLLDELERPAHVSIADLNGDSRSDLVVSGYGNWLGNLSWFEKRPTRGFIRHVLRDQPGTIAAHAHDFDGDGLVDIVALAAHGDEGLFFYRNTGSGAFEEKRVARFPPSYGSNHLALVDFDQDGRMDLVMTNGDNADYRQIQKPYHGIRLFRNVSPGNFEQVFWYPLHGATHAQMHDFDQDGDLDIAAISYFPDFDNSPELGFVYLRNDGKLNFEAFKLKEAKLGRWMVMECTDVDGDGDLDIVLGSHVEGPYAPKELLESWQQHPLPILTLENTLH